LLGEGVLGVVQGKLMAAMGAVGISLSRPWGQLYMRNMRGVAEHITVNTSPALWEPPFHNVPWVSVALFLLPEGSTGLGGFHPSSALPDWGRRTRSWGAG